MYSVRRDFGGFSVVKQSGTENAEVEQTFKGKGAKARAHEHAARLNGQEFIEPSEKAAPAAMLGRGNRSRGGVSRGA